MNPSTARPQRTRSSISRRTVVVGTAWAVPAVVVASAAPALAASLIIKITEVCKAKGSDFTVTVTLAGAAGATATVTSVTIDGMTFSLSSGNVVTVGTPLTLPSVSKSGVNGTFAVAVASSAGPATATVTINGNGCALPS